MTFIPGGTEDAPVELRDREGVILYAPRNAGDAPGWYTNQTAGVCCLHPTARGYFYECRIPPIVRAVTVDFYEIPDDVAAECDAAFAADARTHGWEVDKAKLNESHEAWLHVRVYGEPATAVWENSD